MRGTLEDMVLMIVLGLVAWCVLPFPLAVAVGRAFRNGSGETVSSDHAAA